MASPDAPPFDVAPAHRHFSAHCFNLAWTFIDEPSRTAADDEAMELAALASLWHWTQRPDRTDQNLSIGHWQVSRVYALLRRGPDALRHAERALSCSAHLPPFYLGYAHEAAARAALISGDPTAAANHLALARRHVTQVTDVADRELLERDLRDLERTAQG